MSTGGSTGALPLFPDLRSALTGKFQLFPDLRSALTGKFQLFPDLRSALTGKFQLFPDLRRPFPREFQLSGRFLPKKPYRSVVFFFPLPVSGGGQGGRPLPSPLQNALLPSRPLAERKTHRSTFPCRADGRQFLFL